LDEICNNTIGEIAMKLLIANLKNKKEVLFLETGENDEFNVKGTITIKLDNYDFKNRNNYDPKGKVKTEETLCGIRTGIGDITQIVEKEDTISEAIFHELCHALHKYSGRKMKKYCLLNLIYGKNGSNKYLWTDNEDENPKNLEDDEEMYTITGCHCDGSPEVKRFDPISCNMFDICANILDPEQIVQRVFHCDYKGYKAYREYLIEHGLSESKVLYKIEEFLIDINEYIVKKPFVVADKIMETAEK
jgi:hypothetical protein